MRVRNKKAHTHTPFFGSCTRDKFTSPTMPASTIEQISQRWLGAESAECKGSATESVQQAQPTSEEQLTSKQQKPEATKTRLACKAVACSATTGTACGRITINHMDQVQPEEEVILRVLRIDLVMLRGIDYVDQTFSARFVLHFVIDGGYKMEDLCRDLDPNSTTFPADGGRPGAGWYLNKIDFPTAKEYTILGKEIVPLENEDLHLLVDVAGEFYESMELRKQAVLLPAISIRVRLPCSSLVVAQTAC
jgi:Fe-S cluster assembly iron-binding protein IscA